MKSSLRVVVIDHDEDCRNILINMLLNHCTDVEVLGGFSSLRQGVDAIEQLSPDLVFVEIHLPIEYGCNIVNYFEKVNFEMVFINAFEQYAVKAFDLGALDYLVKPLNSSRLLKTIARAKVAKEKNSFYFNSKLAMKPSLEKIKKIIVPEHGKRRIVSTDDIVAIGADGSYSRIYLSGGQVIVLGKNLKYFTEMLATNNNFLRCHRSWLINMDKILTVSRTNLTIYLSCGVEAKITRSQLDILKNRLLLV